MNRTATLTIAALAVAGLAAPPALAAPKKPITKTWTATAPTPDPTNFAGEGYSVCAQNIPGSFHIQQFKVPAAGTLKVTLSKFQGDWDLLIMDKANKELAASGELPGIDEVAQVKFKKAGVAKIVSCNWAGGPTAAGKLVFTFKK